MANTFGSIRHYSQRPLPAQPDHRRTGHLITLTAVLAALALAVAGQLLTTGTPARPPVGVHLTPASCPQGGTACLERP